MSELNPVKEPSCPYCKASPLRYGCNVQTINNGAIISMIWCVACGAAINVQCLGVQPPQIAPGSLLIKH